MDRGCDIAFSGFLGFTIPWSCLSSDHQVATGARAPQLHSHTILEDGVAVSHKQGLSLGPPIREPLKNLHLR